MTMLQQRQPPRVVAVTGGTAGVGRAIIREFARTGADVGIIAREPGRLAETAKEVESVGRRACAVAADVADAQQVDSAASQIEDNLGPIDCWVNNAMTTVFAPFSHVTPEEFRRATEVTYLGTVYGTMSALRRMSERQHGVIIQVGSALAYRGIPLQSAYCGAKHAIRGFTGAIRCELLHDRNPVELCMVHIPAVNTPQFDWCRSRLPNHPQPVPPIYQPEVAARAVVWAASHPRREMHVGYPTTLAIWGNKVFPAFADQYLADTGYESQQTAEPADSDRSDNLFEPVPGDYAARGSFSKGAVEKSWQWWANSHRGTLLAGAALVLAAVAAFSDRKS